MLRYRLRRAASVLIGPDDDGRPAGDQYSVADGSTQGHPNQFQNVGERPSFTWHAVTFSIRSLLVAESGNNVGFL